jgi:hypothetical protein
METDRVRYFYDFCSWGERERERVRERERERERRKGGQ